MQIHQVTVCARGEVSGTKYANRFMTVCTLPGSPTAKVFSKATQKRIRDFISEISEVSGEVCEAHFKIGRMPYSSNDFAGG